MAPSVGCINEDPFILYRSIVKKLFNVTLGYVLCVRVWDRCGFWQSSRKLNQIGGSLKLQRFLFPPLLGIIYTSPYIYVYPPNRDDVTTCEQKNDQQKNRHFHHYLSPHTIFSHPSISPWQLHYSLYRENFSLMHLTNVSIFLTFFFSDLKKKKSHN